MQGNGFLRVLSFEEAEAWDKIVRSFHDYDCYWLHGYVSSFRMHGDGEPILFYYEDPSVRGVHVVMKRDIAKDPRFQNLIPENRYYDFSTPYGYGGWLIEGDRTNGLFDRYGRWVFKAGIVSEFVRFHPMIQNQEACNDFYEVVPLGEVVHIELDSPENIWRQFSAKNRNHIRKAISSGVKIYNGRFPEAFKRFRQIYNETMQADQANAYYYFSSEFYDVLLHELPGNAQVFWAEKDGEEISASIMLSANGRMNYHLSGMRLPYRSLAPTNLLLYQAALWGAANGCKTLNLGGGVGSGEDSLFQFKRSFHDGPLNRFSIGKKIYQQTTYEALKALRKESVTNERYFPEYRG